jgi:mRNA interferase RelE/StbE
LAWAIKFSDTALKQLKKLDKRVAKEVLDFLDGKIAVLKDPTTSGKGLTGTLATYWRYRVRDMRIICYVDKGEVTVLVLRVGHRSEVYDDEKKIARKAAEDVQGFQKSMKKEGRANNKRAPVESSKGKK